MTNTKVDMYTCSVRVSSLSVYIIYPFHPNHLTVRKRRSDFPLQRSKETGRHATPWHRCRGVSYANCPSALTPRLHNENQTSGQPAKRAVNPPPPAPGLSDSACCKRKGSAFKGRSAVWRMRTGLNRAREWSCGDTVSLTVRTALGLGVDLVTVRRWG